MTQREKDRRLSESAYARGSTKIKIGRLKRNGLLKINKCEFCLKEILIEENKNMFTLNGSEHKCIGFKNQYNKSTSPN